MITRRQALCSGTFALGSFVPAAQLAKAGPLRPNPPLRPIQRKSW